jgi:hypothetical protein
VNPGEMPGGARQMIELGLLADPKIPNVMTLIR